MAGDRTSHRVVVIGGGFGGLYCARALRRAPVHLTLVDRRNFHLFQPLLYQIATGGLSPGEIAAPLRAVLRNQRDAYVLLADVADIDVEKRRVLLRDGGLEYHTLVVATGATTSYFGHPEWARFAPGLKTIEDVRLAVEGRAPVFFHGRTGGMVPTPGEVVTQLRRAWAVTEPRYAWTGEGGTQ